MMGTEESFKISLNSAKESVLDEEKIVTYVSLSKDLCIHINTSKKVLQKLVEKIREEHPEIKINVTYIISGTTGDNSARTTVCTTAELDKVKTTFKAVFFEHIYSVSKGDMLIDPAAYLLTNKYDDFSLCPGLIKSADCFKRTSDEIGSLKSNSQSISIKESKPVIKAPNKLKTESINVSDTKLKNIDDKTTKNHQELKSEVKVISPKKELNGLKQNNKLSNSKTQKGIAGFFNKANGTTPKKVLKESKYETESKIEEKIQVKEEMMDVDEQPKLQQQLDKEKSSQKPRMNKVVNDIKKSAKMDKKRKRVMLVPDSDSDEENDPFVDKQESNHESEDEIPPTPSNTSIKITSGIVNPKKRRKLVDKTYTGDDGFIVTKKEEVYESCSENEEEIKETKEPAPIKIEKTETSPIKVGKTETSPNKKKNGPKASKKKISPPQKGKQSTLTSFFKKM